MPLFRFSRPLLVLFDEERLAFVVLSTPPETAERGLSKKSTGFATNSTAFTQKSTGFSRFFWSMGAQRPTLEEKVHRAGENAPQTRRCIPRFLQPRWVFFCSSPLVPLRKRGGVFALCPLQAAKWLSARSKWARAGESIDEAVRKHGRKGVDTRAQKSTGRRELNVCRREDEALWAKRRPSREPSPSRRGGEVVSPPNFSV